MNKLKGDCFISHDTVCLINTLLKIINTNGTKICLINTLFKIINTNGMKYLVEKNIFNCLNKNISFKKRRLQL